MVHGIFAIVDRTIPIDHGNFAVVDRTGPIDLSNIQITPFTAHKNFAT